MIHLQSKTTCVATTFESDCRLTCHDAKNLIVNIQILKYWYWDNNGIPIKIFVFMHV